MKKIVKTMMKGERETLSEDILKEIDMERKECEQVKNQLLSRLDKQGREDLKRLIKVSQEAAAFKKEESYAQGLRYGILFGLETADCFDRVHSVLYNTYFQDFFCCELPFTNAEIESRESAYFYYETKLAQKLKNNELLHQLDMAIYGMNAPVADEFLMRGFRKGISLGVEAAKLLEDFEKQ